MKERETVYCTRHNLSILTGQARIDFTAGKILVASRLHDQQNGPLFRPQFLNAPLMNISKKKKNILSLPLMLAYHGFFFGVIKWLSTAKSQGHLTKFGMRVSVLHYTFNSKSLHYSLAVTAYESFFSSQNHHLNNFGPIHSVPLP